MSGLYAAVEQFVKDNYPITGREIYGHIPFSDASIRVALSSMRKKGQRKIYISGWVWEDYGHMLRCLPQYSPGNLQDAKKPPKRTTLEHRQRHRNKKRHRVNSVFSLATNVDDRRLTLRKRPDSRREARTVGQSS